MISDEEPCEKCTHRFDQHDESELKCPIFKHHEIMGPQIFGYHETNEFTYEGGTDRP